MALNAIKIVIRNLPRPGWVFRCEYTSLIFMLKIGVDFLRWSLINVKHGKAKSIKRNPVKANVACRPRATASGPTTSSPVIVPQ